MASKLRDPYWFQPRAVRELNKRWGEGARRLCLVSPPGSGKTVMAGMVAANYAPDEVGVITHTLGLERNARMRLSEHTCTVQEIVAKGGLPWKKKKKIIIWDECHHSAGEVWGSAFDHAPKSTLWLGLTGTPQRSDGKSLDGFEDMVVAAHYSELLMAGTIVPYKCLYPKQFRDDAEPDPVAAYKRYGENRKAIFYCRSIEQAHEVADGLGKRAAEWHSQVEWGKRKTVLTAFESNDLRCLVTVDALAEGVDIPDSDCIVLASKCVNVSTYLQKTGRGGRAAPGKTDSLLIDLVGAHLRHGPPTEDREYTISGTGIARKGGVGGGDYYYERGPREAKDLGSFEAELVVGYDWKAPTEADKRRQMGWLVQLAGRRGWTKDVAEAAFTTIFGEEPER